MIKYILYFREVLLLLCDYYFYKILEQELIENIENIEV